MITPQSIIVKVIKDFITEGMERDPCFYYALRGIKLGEHQKDMLRYNHDERRRNAKNALGYFVMAGKLFVQGDDNQFQLVTFGDNP